MARKKGGADKLVVQNAAKTLLANIRFASVDNPIRTLVITSSVPNEGKTIVAVNLAQAIATSGKRVLLVECDMRRRSLADMLGVRAQAGIYAVLADQARVEQAIVATPQQNMDLLDAEPHIPNPADIISSKRFARLVQVLANAYDYVIFDTPPVGAFVDAAILSTMVDGTALVVRDNFTKRDEVVHAFEQLKKAEANILGVILNDCETETSEYYYAYYTKGGKRVKKSEHSGGHASSGAQAGGAQTPDSDLAVDIPTRRGRGRHNVG